MPKVITQQKATAFFRVSAGLDSIDKDAGIIRGVKIAEVGKLATFAGPDGKSRTIKITPEWIDALLGFAGNRAIPMHYGHGWHDASDKPNADEVEMDARIGAVKSFRKDAQGNAVADAYLRGEKKDSILWGAEHNPEDLMFSAVFNYSKDDPHAMPLNLRAADLVPCGAAVTALFSEDPNQETTMQPIDIPALIAALKDPEHGAELIAAIKGAIKSVESKDDAAEADAAEAEAGVTDADKKPSDDAKPALMRSALRINRATARLAKSHEDEILTKAEARFTKAIGTGKFTLPPGGGNEAPTVEAKLGAYIAAGAKDRATAIMRFAHDKPDEYNAAVAAGQV